MLSPRSRTATSTEISNELFLVRLRYKEGRMVEIGGHKPILLNHPNLVWVVFSGEVELFVVPLTQNEVSGTRRHLMTLQAGQAMFGQDLDMVQGQLGLLAVGVGPTKLIQVNLARLSKMSEEKGFSKYVVNLAEVWAMKLSEALIPNTPPHQTKLVIKLWQDEEITLSREVAVIARSHLIWVKLLMGQAHFMGQPALTLPLDCFIPLTKQTWLQAATTSWLEVAKLGAEDKPTHQQTFIWAGIAQLQTLLLQFALQEWQTHQQAEQDLLQKKHAARQRIMTHALTHLANILEPPRPFTSEDTAPTYPLLAAARLVGEALHLPIQAGHSLRQTLSLEQQLTEIAQASTIRTRKVALRGTWWQYEVSPLLAFLQPLSEVEPDPLNPLAELSRNLTAPHPVAILPTRNGYELVDPVTAQHFPFTPAMSANLSYFAYTFYRPLPHHRLTLRHILRFGLFGLQRDLWTILMTQTCIGLLNLALPLATGILLEIIIPRAATTQLWQLMVALITVTLATTLLQLTRNFAFLRLQAKADAAIQAAVWDRLLRLPTPFFRQYTSGDLAVRAGGINTIKEYLTNSTINALFGGVAFPFYLALLFYYSPYLALVGLALVLLAVGVTTLVGLIKLRYQRRLLNLEGHISGMVSQFIKGIAKFRASGTENWAFATWASQFKRQRQWSFKAETAANSLVVFNASYPIFAALGLFLALTWLYPQLTRDFSTGHFLGFYTAFSLLLVCALDFTNTVIHLLNIIPIYERLRPILTTKPEIDELQLHPGELTGAVELNNVFFRYQTDGPLILRGLSLQIKPGQFVALVGASGSGKSTLLRLLLGFEQPESGAVYYDRQDLKTLNIQAVRRQIGTVLQSGGLMPGTIFSNIVGSLPLTLDEAWKAARLAGLGEDIEQLPMGMQTVISEGATTFSGGQRQRLLIARAIVNHPRILLFDEATSALDNRTQAVVSKSLESLQSTRIVIAHRLSTVIHADVIFVIDKGQVVQHGTYQQLINQPGPFADLAKRQLT